MTQPVAYVVLLLLCTSAHGQEWGRYSDGRIPPPLYTAERFNAPEFDMRPIIAPPPHEWKNKIPSKMLRSDHEPFKRPPTIGVNKK